MVKIFKLNKTGTTGVVINKQMKAAGYEQGKEVAWEAMTGGFMLKLVSKPPQPTNRASGATNGNNASGLTFEALPYL